MKTKTINLYEFKELSAKAKQKAINKYYEDETYEFLSDDLTESCKALLTENEVEYSDIKLYYSLSSSQGDGLCFIGKLTKNGITLSLTHSARYYYANSVNMRFWDEEGNDIEELQPDKILELRNIYFDICSKLEKEGYGILEYRMSEKEFTEHSEANEYTYLEDGTMENF